MNVYVIHFYSYYSILHSLLLFITLVVVRCTCVSCPELNLVFVTLQWNKKEICTRVFAHDHFVGWLFGGQQPRYLIRADIECKKLKMVISSWIIRVWSIKHSILACMMIAFLFLKRCRSYISNFKITTFTIWYMGCVVVLVSPYLRDWM